MAATLCSAASVSEGTSIEIASLGRGRKRSSACSSSAIVVQFPFAAGGAGRAEHLPVGVRVCAAAIGPYGVGIRAARRGRRIQETVQHEERRRQRDQHEKLEIARKREEPRQNLFHLLLLMLPPGIYSLERSIIKSRAATRRRRCSGSSVRSAARSNSAAATVKTPSRA